MVGRKEWDSRASVFAFFFSFFLGGGSFVLVGSQDVVVAGSRRLLGVHVQHCLCSGTALVASQGSQWVELAVSFCARSLSSWKVLLWALGQPWLWGWMDFGSDGLRIRHLQHMGAFLQSWSLCCEHHLSCWALSSSAGQVCSPYVAAGAQRCAVLLAALVAAAPQGLTALQCYKMCSAERPLL